MKLPIILIVLSLTTACASQQQQNQGPLTWTHEPTIADYRDRATNAPDPIVSAVWTQLINTYHWCNDLSQSQTHQKRCKIQIDRLRNAITDLRIVKESLCGDFVERNKCATEVAQALHISSREIVNAGEKLRIAQDL